MTKRTFLPVGILLAILAVSPQAYSQNKLESWYTYWGLGYADIKYPGELDAALDQLANLDGVDHVSVSIDLLGFYLPFGERHINGFIINAFGDRYEANGTDLQISGNTLSFSSMRFLTGAIGKGLFIRGDIGGSRIVVDADGENETSDWGFGFLVGGGFGFNISSGTRILLNANYAVRRVEGDAYKTVGISVGGLF